MEKSSTMLGSKRLVRKNEFVRVVIQCLYSLGYEKSAACFESESGISLISAERKKLESSTLDANWDSCIESLQGCEGLTEETRSSALFLVLRQWLLECLYHGEDSLALEILRKRISELQVCREKAYKLAVGLLYPLKGMGLEKIDGEVIHELRKSLFVELERVLPPPFTLPERRLEHLVEMAVSSQIDACMYHNSVPEISLYEDHACSCDQIPTETVQLARRLAYTTCYHYSISFKVFSPSEFVKRFKPQLLYCCRF